jgi:peptidyl-prolyl cis-trans isomerase D
VAAAHGLILQANQTVTRASNMENAPADLSDKLFALSVPGAATLTAPGRADVVQLTAISPFDPTTEASKAMLELANSQLGGQLGAELFEVYAQTIRDQAGVTINDALLQSLLSRMN